MRPRYLYFNLRAVDALVYLYIGVYKYTKKKDLPFD